MSILNKEISISVRQALAQRGETLETCCSKHNQKYNKEIADKKLRPLNKDFLSRVARGKFTIFSLRVSKLCEFLEIDITTTKTNKTVLLALQIADFQRMIETNKELKKRFSNLSQVLEAINIGISGDS